MLNTSRALLKVEPGTLDTHDRGSECLVGELSSARANLLLNSSAGPPLHALHLEP